MSGPWEKYQTAGPWTKYKKEPPVDIAGAERAAVAGVVDRMGVGGRLAAGMGAGMTDLALGVKQLVGAASGADATAKKAQDAALMSTGAGVTGNIAGKVATALPAMFVPGANTAAGASLLGAAMGAAEPVEGNVAAGKAKSAAVGAALGYVGNKAGNYIGNKLIDRAARKQAEAATRAVAGSVKDATTKAGQQAGYVVPPTHANPTATNRLLEGISGKLTMAQRAAERNQEVTDQLARKALGISPTVELTKETLEQVRSQAGAAYEAIKQMPIRIVSDAKYQTDLQGVLAQSRAIAADFPDLADDSLESLVKSVSGTDFSPESVIEVIKKFRTDATALFRNANTRGTLDQARAMRELADSLENLLSRNLKPYPDMYSAFTEARKLIAKTHSVEAALNEGTGHIVASKLAQQMGKKPLTGELKLIAKFSRAYPRATQEITSSMPGVSPLDFYGGGGLSVASDSLIPMAIPAARVASREAVLSPMFQRAMTTPNYNPGAVNAMLPAIGNAAKKVTPPLLIYAEQQ